MDNRRWVTLFSRSGSEILALEKALGVKSTRITTRKSFKDSLIPRKECMWTDGSSESLNQLLQPGDIITLHGYLKIIPEDVCSEFSMFNGHPGLITEYPELKGINPQEKVADLNKYPEIGAVIHHVTPGVDEGSVIISSKANNPGEIEGIYSKLSSLSLRNWVEFFRGSHYNTHNESGDEE